MPWRRRPHETADRFCGPLLLQGSVQRASVPAIRSRTTALPSSSPAAAGTQGVLAGTLRRPGGGVYGWAGVTGSSGENTTF